MQSIEQLIEEILSLPCRSRAILIEKLLESLEFDPDQVIQETWTTEAKRRRDEVQSGLVQTVPGNEALAQIRLLLEQ
jgi:putative addiction module component (TIGR02574 family)